MTLKHLKIYLAVYRTENVTRAAQDLHMTQPAVTRAIQEIEHYYGVRLFERINRRLYVTEIGREFYAYALHITDSFHQMERELRNWDEFGILRLGTSISIGSHLLPRVLTQGKQRHPTLNIQTTVSNAQNLKNALLDNRLDFAVMEGGFNHELLETRFLSRDCLVPVLPPDHPRRGTDVSLAQLTEGPLLLREPGSAGREFVDHVFALHGISAQPVMESISTHVILQSVHAGLGLSFLPRHLVLEHIRSGFVSTCRLTDEQFLRENHLVWHRHKFLTQSAKDIMSIFQEEARREEQSE